MKTKWDHPAPAEDLYISPLFRRRREFAESSGLPWFVLSAKSGLIAPEEVIVPYDVAMVALPDTPLRLRLSERRKRLLTSLDVVGDGDAP